jgi:hypothetical protein
MCITPSHAYVRNSIPDGFDEDGSLDAEQGMAKVATIYKPDGLRNRITQDGRRNNVRSQQHITWLKRISDRDKHLHGVLGNDLFLVERKIARELCTSHVHKT